MGDRTSPEDSAERIAWELNYHKGEEISLNELAERTSLSWATVKKYTDLIETLQNVTPEIAISSDGVRSGERTDILESVLSEPEQALAVYILLQAESNGGATAKVDTGVLRTVVEDPEILNEMEQLGWIKRSDDDVQLTPLGVKIAGKARSEVRSSTREITQDSQTGWKSEYTNAESSTGYGQRYEINDLTGEANNQPDSHDQSENTLLSAPAT